MPVPISQTLTLTSTLVPKEELNMPFIDDELLWCPDNDGKMVDLTQCLQDNSAGQSTDSFSTMELNGLVVDDPAVPNLPDESSVNAAPLANNNNDTAVNNGNLPNTSDESFDTLDTFLRELQADLAEASQPSSTTSTVDAAAAAAAACRRQKYNIAAANPLLAEKLATPTSQTSSTSISYASRADIKTESVQPEPTKGNNRDGGVNDSTQEFENDHTF